METRYPYDVSISNPENVFPTKSVIRVNAVNKYHARELAYKEHNHIQPEINKYSFGKKIKK